MTSRSRLQYSIWVCSQQYGVIGDRTMAGVNYNDVWTEVSDPEFANEEPETELDIKHIRNTFQLIEDGVEMLNGPIPLTQEQRNVLMIHIEKLQDKLYEDSILVNRVDSRVSIYERTPLNDVFNVGQD